MGKIRKSLDELTLMDRFLFDEVMEDPENVKILLDIILDDEIVLKELPQTEKEFRLNEWNKYIKLDVWAKDTNDVVYDAEVQKHNTGNLPKRSRYYQGMLDTSMLGVGEDYNDLSKVIIIMIMPFDLFGKGRYKYTFQNSCDEVPGLELGDDAIRIFLNTKGTNEAGVSKELIELMHYMEDTNNVDRNFFGGKLKRLQQNVKKIQQNAEKGVKFMKWWEELMDARSAGRAEGENRLSKLMQFLFGEGEIEAVQKALSDANYRAELYKKYNL